MASANAFGFSLGDALAQAEEIKRARIQNAFLPKASALDIQAAETGNAMSALQLQQAQKGVADTAAIEGARNDAATAAGITGPEKTLLTIDPGKAAELKTYVQSLDDEGMKTLLSNVDQMGQAAAYIKSAEDPEAAYLKVKGLLPKQLQQTLPPIYDAGFVDHALAQSTEMHDLITGMKPGGSDALLKDAPANYMWTDASRTKLKAIPGGPKDPTIKGTTTLETTAANAIRSTVLSAFGGIYDPTTGEIGGLDPDQANRAIAIMADAEEFAATEGLPPAQAVKKAMAKAGVSGNDAAGGDVPTPQTQEEYDALPSGAVYIDPDDNQKHTKP